VTETMFCLRMADVFLAAATPAGANLADAGLPDAASRQVATACQYMLMVRHELNQHQGGEALFMRLATKSYQMLEEEVKKIFEMLEKGGYASAELNRFISLLDGSLTQEKTADLNTIPYEHRLLALTTIARFIRKYGLRDLERAELGEVIEDLNQNMLAIDMEAQMFFTDKPDVGEKLPLKQYLSRLNSVVCVGLREELLALKQAGL